MPRRTLPAEWYKPGGIKDSPSESAEIRAPGVRKCVIWESAEEIELKRLLIEPEARGLGIGSKIVRALQSRGKRIVLYAVSDEGRQSDLERFYARLGFQVDFFDPERLVWEPRRPTSSRFDSVLTGCSCEQCKL